MHKDKNTILRLADFETKLLVWNYFNMLLAILGHHEMWNIVRSAHKQFETATCIDQ